MPKPTPAQREREARKSLEEDIRLSVHTWGRGEYLVEQLAAYKRAILAAERATKACAWSADDDGNWDTACGQTFVLTFGTPADNRMAFCCYCGGKLAERARRAEESQ